VEKNLPQDVLKKKKIIEVLASKHEILPKAKISRPEMRIDENTEKEVINFHNSEEVSYQAPGRRDCITLKENGIKMERQKKYLL
jgi:hypothetical protein